jgi:hypothetical protein|tara:strand:- start:325 stop:711 length:387 start_codon:yes stop_codon:yes gene_type:complete
MTAYLPKNSPSVSKDSEILQVGALRKLSRANRYDLDSISNAVRDNINTDNTIRYLKSARSFLKACSPCPGQKIAYIKGATEVPWVKIISVLNIKAKIKTGKSQYFFLSSMNFINSLRNAIFQIQAVKK